MPAPLPPHARRAAGHTGPLAASARFFTVAPAPGSLAHPVSCRINDLREPCARDGRDARSPPGLPGGRRLTTTLGSDGLPRVGCCGVVVGENAPSGAENRRLRQRHDFFAIRLSPPVHKGPFEPSRKNPRGCCQWALI